MLLIPAANLAVVSTHSRLKAAGPLRPRARGLRYCFNTQPPKGGWFEKNQDEIIEYYKFQHTAA